MWASQGKVSFSNKQKPSSFSGCCVCVTAFRFLWVCKCVCMFMFAYPSLSSIQQSGFARRTGHKRSMWVCYLRYFWKRYFCCRRKVWCNLWHAGDFSSFVFAHTRTCLSRQGAQGSRVDLWPVSCHNVLGRDSKRNLTHWPRKCQHFVPKEDCKWINTREQKDGDGQTNRKEGGGGVGEITTFVVL